MAYASKNKVQPGSALLVLFLMALAVSAHADGVYKWVDENGRAHYTDKPPKQGEHTQLRTQAAPVIKKEESAGTESYLTPEQLEQIRQSELSVRRFQEEQRKRERAEREKSDADQKRYQDKLVAQQSAGDAALIDECKRNREVYCDKGLDKIKHEQEMRLIDEEIERKRRISGRDRYR